MLANGRTPEDVVEAIEARVGKLTASAAFMLGTALYESGADEPAEVQFRAVLDQQPSSAPAREALAETLLSQGPYVDAAAEAAKVTDDDPSAGAARRTQLFGLLVEG